MNIIELLEKSVKKWLDKPSTTTLIILMIAELKLVKLGKIALFFSMLVFGFYAARELALMIFK